jgi:hypothetical protein
MKLNHLTGIGLALAASGFSASALAETRVSSVYADRVAHVLYVDGGDFTSGLLLGNIPYVELNGSRLTVNQATLTNTHLEAALPTTLADGDYQVFISQVSGLLNLGLVQTVAHTVDATLRTSFSLALATAVAGPQGPQGIQGLTGATGAIGATGATGPQGLQGLTGAVGPAGAQGIQGLTGATGATGATGPQGLQGLTGATGAKGDTGAQGIQGLTGAIGPIGPIGPNGAQGPQGLTGLTGAVGPQGIQGLKGDVGATGAQGLQGLTGAAGPQGLQGLTGAVGPKGDTGAEGLQGLTGAIGPAGPQGLQGLTGAIGPMGPQGLQGVAGDVGLQGPQGDPGPAGPAGVSGFASATSSRIWLGAGDKATATAICASGKKAIGGGYTILGTDTNKVTMVAAAALAADRYTVQIRRITGQTGNLNAGVLAQAFCATVQ